MCVGCAVALEHSGESLCPSCRARLPWLTGRRCSRCALPAPCDPCPARAAAFDRSWAPLAHAEAARTVVSALKFRGGLAVADLMAAQMVATAPKDLLAGAVLVPVPPRPASRRERGFDQAERIARALARRSNRPLARCLRRGDAGGRQVGSGRRDRLAPGRIAVSVRGPPPSRATLVDDVHTTGATLEACARALRGAGAQRVAAMTYTRTLAPGWRGA